MKKSRIFLYLRFLKLFHAKRQPHKPGGTQQFFFFLRGGSAPSLIFLTEKVLLSYGALFTYNFGSFQCRTF